MRRVVGSFRNGSAAIGAFCLVSFWIIGFASGKQIEETQFYGLAIAYGCACGVVHSSLSAVLGIATGEVTPPAQDDSLS